jgi:hypothetical protein
VVAFIRCGTGLYGDVGIKRTAAMISVENIVHLADRGIQEREGSINGELNDWNHSSFNQLDLSKTWMCFEYFLQPLQSCFYPFSLWQELHIGKKRIINSYVNIAIFNGNSAGTTAK